MQKTLQALQEKRKSPKGFTLMEMLIVVAIIAVLVAIAIPVFNTQMDNAKEQVDAANLRSATSMAVTAYLTTDPTPTTDQTYYAVRTKPDANSTDASQYTLTVSTTAPSDSPAVGAPEYYPSKTGQGHIEVVIDSDGKVTSAKWTA